MRTVVITIVLVLLLCVPGYTQSEYPSRSAIIKYQIKGDMQEGTEEMYIDEGGKRFCIINRTTVKIGGFVNDTETMTINDGEYIYNIDLKTNQGIRSSLNKEGLSQQKEITEKRMLTVERMKKEFKIVGKEKVLGRECDIYQGAGTRSWIWNNLVLRQELKLLGKITKEAIDLQIDIPIPKDRFRVPPEVTITETSEEMPQIM